jgi:hypothetical protein
LIESLYLDIDGHVDVMAEIDLCLDWKKVTRDITEVGVAIDISAMAGFHP